MQDQRLEYDRIVAPVQDRMMRCIWRIVRDSADAEDALQNALLSIWKRWDQVCRHPNPHALVLRIAIHAAHDMLRRRVRGLQRFADDALLAELPDRAASADQQVSLAQQDAIVLRAIGRLSRNQAHVILMHTFESFSYAEIAAAMHCREATVRKHASRARSHLRKLLAPLMSPSPIEASEEIHA